MKKHLLFFILLSGIIVSACKTAQCPPLSTEQKADIEKQIRGLVDKLIISVEKLDIDSFSSFFSTDEFLASYSEGSAKQSKTNWVNGTKAWFNQQKSAELDDKVNVFVLSADLALADRVGTYKVNFKNDSISSSTQALTYVFKKEASEWKIIHVHESIKDK